MGAFFSILPFVNPIRGCFGSASCYCPKHTVSMFGSSTFTNKLAKMDPADTMLTLFCRILAAAAQLNQSGPRPEKRSGRRQQGNPAGEPPPPFVHFRRSVWGKVGRHLCPPTPPEQGGATPSEDNRTHTTASNYAWPKGSTADSGP